MEQPITLICNIPGEHGMALVGPFATKEEADTFRKKAKAIGCNVIDTNYAVTSPEDYLANPSRPSRFTGVREGNE